MFIVFFMMLWVLRDSAQCASQWYVVCLWTLLSELVYDAHCAPPWCFVLVGDDGCARWWFWVRLLVILSVHWLSLVFFFMRCYVYFWCFLCSLMMLSVLNAFSFLYNWFFSAPTFGEKYWPVPFFDMEGCTVVNFMRTWDVGLSPANGTGHKSSTLYA